MALSRPGSFASADIVEAGSNGAAARGRSGPGIVADVLEDLGLSSLKLLPGNATAGATEAGDAHSSEGSSTGELKPEERQGLYALAGIVSAGYLFSKIFT